MVRIEMNVNTKVLAANLVGMMAVFGVVLFGAAGTLAWTAGWIFLVLFSLFTVTLSLWLLKHDPGLLKERMTLFKPDQKAWDKIFLPIALVGFLGWLVLMPLDAVRFHWSSVPVWLQAAGAIIMLMSFYLFFL